MKNITVAVLALALFSCGGKGPVAGQDAMKVKLESFMDRESNGLAPAETSGDLKLTVLSKGKPTAKISNKEKPVQYDITIPIGAAVDVTCTLTEQMSSPAVVLKSVFDNIAKVPEIESAGFKTLEAGIFTNIGYMYLESEYLTKDKKYGTAKLAAGSSVKVSFYCSHDELGYKKTFLKVVDSFARSAPVQNFLKDFSGYERRQIDIAYMNNMAVGYAESYQFPGEGETKKTFSITTYLVPRSATELMTGDSVDTTVYNAKTGALVSGSYNSYENDETDHEIEIEQVAAKQYTARGEMQGKKFEKTFGSREQLVYSGFILDQYSAGTTTKKEWTFEEYVPLSPVKPTAGKIVLKEQMPNGNKKVEYSFHTLKARIELDKKSYETLDLDMGGVTFLLKRSYYDAP